jgi:hypothetical protein
MAESDEAQRKMAALLTSSPIGKEAAKKVATEKKSDKKSEKKKGLFSFGSSSTKKEGLAQDRITSEMGPHFNDLWNASNPHSTSIPVASMRLPGSNPTTKKNENGCWVIYNSKTDVLRFEDFTAPGDRDSCIPGVPTLQSHERVAAFFHTHPNTKDEGYNKGPSGADVSFANSNGFPGVVRSQLGGYTWFGPAVS